MCCVQDGFFSSGKITIRLISEFNYFEISDSWVWAAKDLKKLPDPVLRGLIHVTLGARASSCTGAVHSEWGGGCLL